MQQTMLSGARWARENRLTAILIITLSKILIGLIAFNLGVLAFVSGLAIPFFLKWLFATAGVAALLSYPTIQMKAVLGFEPYFLKQKRSDLMMAGLGIFLWFFIGNQSAQWTTKPVVTETISTVSTVSANGSLVGKIKGWATPERARGLAKYAQRKLKDRIIRKIEAWGKQSDNNTIAIQILLTLLSIVLLIVLAYLVAALACNLSCSGNDTAAALVLILGWGGLLIGFFFALKAIWWDYARRGQGSSIDDRHKKKDTP